MDEGQESFPRGGQQLLTPLEKIIIKNQAKQDLLFGEVRFINCMTRLHFYGG